MFKNLFSLSFMLLFIFSSEKTPTEIYPKFPMRISINEKALKKEPRDNPESRFLNFGEKIKVISKKEFKGRLYLNVELSDKKKSWICSDYLTRQYVVINKADTLVYSSASNYSLNKNIILQTGDMGYLKKEKNGFLNVEFISYMPRGKDNKILWIGSVWIKDGYILGDIKMTKEAYSLANAYNQLYMKTEKNINKESAKQYLKEAITVNGKEKTEIAKIAEKILQKL